MRGNPYNSARLKGSEMFCFVSLCLPDEGSCILHNESFPYMTEAISLCCSVIMTVDNPPFCLRSQANFAFTAIFLHLLWLSPATPLARRLFDMCSQSTPGFLEGQGWAVFVLRLKETVWKLLLWEWVVIVGSAVINCVVFLRSRAAWMRATRNRRWRDTLHYFVLQRRSCASMPLHPDGYCNSLNPGFTRPRAGTRSH